MRSTISTTNTRVVTLQSRATVPSGIRTFQYDHQRAVMPARDYQVELVRYAWSAVQASTPGERLAVTLATGGGKTRVLLDLIFLHLIPMGARVLWVAPGWELIAQAMADACARYPQAREMTTCIGGTGAAGVLFGAPRAPDAMLTFVTLQTCSARRHSDFASLNFDLVVFDELHYGEHGTQQSAVFEMFKGAATFLGTTATARADSTYRVVGNFYDLQALVERGVLARPQLISVATNIDWTPGVDDVGGDFTARSLNELGRNDARNQIIVNTYLQEASRLGPTMVFACDIGHANRLVAMFRDAGVRAAVTHYRMAKEKREEAISHFRSGGLDVIVNVRSLTMGVDIPHTQGLLLARPTTSDILVVQMIGRGSRKTLTKNTFFVVDFVDTVSGPNSVYVNRPAGFLGTPTRPTNRRPMHDYVPATLTSVSTGNLAIDGLEIQPEQTFAVEFELTPNSRSTALPADMAMDLELTMAASLPAMAPLDALLQWRASVKENRVVVSSAIYKGAAGLSELVRVVDAVASTAAAHGYALVTGEPLHVLFGWGPDLISLKEAVR